MFLLDKEFLRDEMSCPLLKNNRGYLETHLKLATARVKPWRRYILDTELSSASAIAIADTSADPSPVVTRMRDLQLTASPPSIKGKSTESSSEPVSEALSDIELKVISKPERILLRDAERTFLKEKQRRILISMCTALKQLFGDYQQTVSYVCGILLLFYDKQTVFEMMVVLGQSPKYAMRGYWRHEALDQAIDANVLFELLAVSNPKVHRHLKECGILPQTFVQKYFGCLGVQVLPIDTVLEMWGQFFKYGLKYLFKFTLALLDHLGPAILATTSPNTLYEILGLDPKCKFYARSTKRVAFATSQLKKHLADGSSAVAAEMCDREKEALMNDWMYRQFFREVLAGANSIGDKYNLDKIDLHKMRVAAYHSFLKPSMLSAAVSNNLAGVKIEDDDSEGEPEDCGLCEDGFGDWFCFECEVHLCDTCHDNEEGDHSQLHRTEMVEEEID